MAADLDPLGLPVLVPVGVVNLRVVQVPETLRKAIQTSRGLAQPLHHWPEH